MTLSTIHNASLNLQRAYFVTGTDTEIGKTTVTTSLVKALAEQNKTVYAIKPVTAGLATTPTGEKYSEDAQRTNAFANVKPPLSAIAPFLLNTPSSPHIASRIDGIPLTAQQIIANVRQTLHDYPADTVLIEGAGGWFTPINDNETLADVATLLNLPVVVVVGVKLGCLNHAVLTIQAVQQAGLNVAGIVFNQLSADTDYYQEQVAWLSQYLQRQYADEQHTPIIFLQNFYVF